MSTTLLRPPDGVHAFTFHFGCGKPHEYDGSHAIDCPACVELVRLMSPDERVSHPELRAPIVVAGDTPGEIDALRRVAEAKREAASWRLVDAEDVEEEPAATDDGHLLAGERAAAAELVAENDRLRQENEELRGRLSRKRTTA